MLEHDEGDTCCIDHNAPSSVLAQERESLTESMLRNDIVAPRVVRFTPRRHARSNQKWMRRLTIVAAVLLLSISSIIFFQKVLNRVAHEALLDIETNNKLLAEQSKADDQQPQQFNHTGDEAAVILNHRYYKELDEAADNSIP